LEVIVPSDIEAVMKIKKLLFPEVGEKELFAWEQAFI